MSTILHTFDLRTGALTGSRPAQVVGSKELTVCVNATPVVPPADIPDGHAARWTGSAWEVAEDHRQHMDSKGTKTGGTPFWLPVKGDDYTSPSRYMDSLGPLPEGAVTERPAKPLSVLKAEKEHEIKTACDAAIVASLTMPTSAPSSAEVAVAAASLAGIDPDGPDTLLALHTARRDELLATVAAAKSPTDLDSVVVSYAV